jgi:hypothetical protein
VNVTPFDLLEIPRRLKGFCCIDQGMVGIVEEFGARDKRKMMMEGARSYVKS